jgi:predicted nucleic acid-binding protein
VREATRNDIYRQLSKASDLSEVDAEVLALADAEDATAVIDERRGRTVPEVEGIDVRGTAFLLLSSVEEVGITAEKGRDLGWDGRFGLVLLEVIVHEDPR